MGLLILNTGILVKAVMAMHVGMLAMYGLYERLNERVWSMRSMFFIFAHP